MEKQDEKRSHSKQAVERQRSCCSAAEKGMSARMDEGQTKFYFKKRKKGATTNTQERELKRSDQAMSRQVLHALPGGHAFWRPETKIACDL